MEWGAWGGVHGQVWLGGTLAYLFADGAEMAQSYSGSRVFCLGVSHVCVCVCRIFVSCEDPWGVGTRGPCAVIASFLCAFDSHA